VEYFYQTYHFDKKIRLGQNSDGGYVIADLEGGYDCYLSCGVNDEESFSRDFLTKISVPALSAFAFDATIDSYPHTYGSDIFFIKKNIGPLQSGDQTNLKPLLDKYADIFLKMDIEGWEWKWLNSSEVDLSTIKQIVIELHGTCGEDWGSTRSEKNMALTKLLKTHTLIHCHANNWGNTYEKNFWGDRFPSVIECTFIRNNELKTKQLNKTPLPILGLDYKNRHHRDEIDLNFWPFVELEQQNLLVQKNIFQTYKGELEELDDEILENIDVIKRLNPDWNYRYFSDLDCDKWVSQNYPGEVYDIWSRIKIGVAKSDLFRYLLIYKEGGVYLDIKSSIVYPLDYILRDQTEIVFQHWKEKYHHKILKYQFGEFQNWFLIFPKGHGILQHCIERVIQNLKNYQFDPVEDIKFQILKTTGPIAYSQSILEWIEKKGRHGIVEHESTQNDGWPTGLVYSFYTLFGKFYADKIKSYENNIPII